MLTGAKQGLLAARLPKCPDGWTVREVGKNALGVFEGDMPRMAAPTRPGFEGRVRLCLLAFAYADWDKRRLHRLERLACRERDASLHPKARSFFRSEAEAFHEERMRTFERSDRAAGLALGRKGRRR